MDKQIFVSLSKKQREKLADLFFDIAKAFYVAVLAMPIVFLSTDIFLTIRSLAVAFISTIIGLDLLKCRKKPCQ